MIDTILSRVFKAKYYPKEGFLEAKLGHNPSYVWRSIHASQVVVKHGLRWWLGKGDKINVWRQPWLREIDNALITTSLIHGKENMKVSDLINHETRSWRRELIHQIFCPRDVAPIERIPLNLLHDDDTPIWKFSKNESYSVSSAYYKLMEVIIDNNHLKVEGNWKKLWQLKVPNRVKIFLWRALRECLPVRSRLINKGVHCEPKCPICWVCSSAGGVE
jgi:hypothetical protein